MIISLSIRRNLGDPNRDTILGQFRFSADIQFQCVIEQIEMIVAAPRRPDGSLQPAEVAKVLVEQWRASGKPLPRQARLSIREALQLIDTITPYPEDLEENPSHRIRGSDMEIMKNIIRGAVSGALEYPDKTYVEIVTIE